MLKWNVMLHRVENVSLNISMISFTFLPSYLFCGFLFAKGKVFFLKRLAQLVKN